MDIKTLQRKLKGAVSNYKYVLIVLVVGLLLMLVPTSKKAESKNTPVTDAAPQITHEEKIANILRQIYGVGEVQVLLSTESTGETIYQTDIDVTESSDAKDQKNKTVILTDSERNQTALVQSAGAPVYRGAVIVCQGGDQASVKLAVTQAVIKATGLSADRICVLKMK